MVTKGIRIQDTTNLVAEERDIKEGLLFCRDYFINNVILESHSLAFVQMGKREWKIPLCWIFANLVFSLAGIYHIGQFQDIPRMKKNLNSRQARSTKYKEGYGR